MLLMEGVVVVLLWSDIFWVLLDYYIIVLLDWNVIDGILICSIEILCYGVVDMFENLVVGFVVGYLCIIVCFVREMFNWLGVKGFWGVDCLGLFMFNIFLLIVFLRELVVVRELGLLMWYS